MCNYCDTEGMTDNLIECKIPLFGLPNDECTVELAVWVNCGDMILQLDGVNDTNINNGDLGKTKIKYCPMCGRKL